MSEATPVERVLRTLHAVPRGARVLIWPIVVSIAASACFALPDQTIEIYRALAVASRHDPDLPGKLVEIALAAASLLALAQALRYATRRLLSAAAAGGYLDEAPTRWLFQIATAIVPALPVAACGYGALRGRTGVPPPDVASATNRALAQVLHLPEEDEQFFAAGLSHYTSGDRHLLLAGIVLLCIAAALVVASWIWDGRRSPQALWQTSFAERIFNRLAWLATVCAVIAVFAVAPIRGWQVVGPLAAGGIFFYVLTHVLTQLKLWSESSRVPLIAGLLTLGLACSHFDINDNHQIRRVDVAAATGAAPPAQRVSDAFLEWLKSPVRGRFSGDRRYPVYIVAAEGGGIYAAYHAASFLAGLQDQCPDFSRHLFAISGVSGGAVGAGIFAALAAAPAPAGNAAAAGTAAAPTDGCRVARADQSVRLVDTIDGVMKRDFLSPLVAAMLFPDFLQRFIPYPFPRLDRAAALERAFEDALDAGAANGDRNMLRAPYVGHWSPRAATPAILANTTEVGSGRRRIISPFKFDRTDILVFPVWDKDAAAQGAMPLSTAISLSARFPWLSPPGWFVEPRQGTVGAASAGTRNEPTPPRKIRLVDGGYFENSGVATALDMMQEIDAALAGSEFASRVVVNLIVLTSSGYPRQDYFGLGEAIDPIRALLNTREARAEIAITDAERLLNPAEPGAGTGGAGSRPTRLRKVQLRDMGFPLPLGWRLSDLTRLLIFAQNGIPEQCRPDSRGRQTNPARFDADCVVAEILDELR